MQMLFVCGHHSSCVLRTIGVRLSAGLPSPATDGNGDMQLLRPCQRDCLDACAKGARVLEMACGTGKTRVIQELASNVSGRVPGPLIQFWLIPGCCSLVLVKLGRHRKSSPIGLRTFSTLFGRFLGQLSIVKCSNNHPYGCCQMMQDAYASNCGIHPPSFGHCIQFRSFGSYLVIVVCLYLV